MNRIAKIAQYARLLLELLGGRPTMKKVRRSKVREVIEKYRARKKS